MSRRLAVALAAVAVVLGVAACTPKGQPCDEAGARLYTSNYGNFICDPGPFGDLRWEKA